MPEAPRSYAIKAPVPDPTAAAQAFRNQKTMYGGKTITVGAVVYLFDSENRGGRGLFAWGVATAVEAVAGDPDAGRQTPRVNVAVERRAAARDRLGRAELKAFSRWDDGRPETELNFKLYRQATDKLIGLSVAASDFLDRYF